MVCKTHRGVVSDGENLGPADDSAVFLTRDPALREPQCGAAP